MRSEITQLLFLTLIFLAMLCNAQTSQTSTASLPGGADKKVSGLALLQHSENLYQDLNKVSSTTLSLTGALKLNSDLSLGAAAAIDQSHTGPKDTALSNIKLSLKRSWNLSSAKTGIALIGVLPTDHQIQVRDRFQGAAGVGFVADSLGPSSLGVSWSSGVYKNIHQYTTNAEGSPLIEFYQQNVLSLEYHFSSGVSVSTELGYMWGRTYGGFRRDKFSSALDLNLNLTPVWIAGVGVSTEGNAFKYNGTESNMRFFNDNTSVIRSGVSYVF